MFAAHLQLALEISHVQCGVVYYLIINEHTFNLKVLFLLHVSVFIMMRMVKN